MGPENCAADRWLSGFSFPLRRANLRGKSSLSGQIQGIAHRDEAHLRLVKLEDGDFPNSFLVAEHISQQGQTVVDIAASLLRELDRARNFSGKAFKLELQLDLKVITASLVPAESGSAPDLTAAFVDRVESVWREVDGQGLNGIVLAVDKVDRVAENTQVGTFFKVATEMMSARGLENVMFLAVGAVGVQELLKLDHASAVRVFEAIPIPVLNAEESAAVVCQALEGAGVGVVAEVNEQIAWMAGGYPNPIHVIGSEAFDADTDDCIDWDDYDVAIQSVVTEKRKDQFDDNYIEAGSGKYREIIKVMANYEEVDVPSRYICEQLGVQQPQISSNINELMKRDVIVRVDRGVYRLKDPLFGVYVQYLDVLGAEPVERRPRRRRH